MNVQILGDESELSQIMILCILFDFILFDSRSSEPYHVAYDLHRLRLEDYLSFLFIVVTVFLFVATLIS